MALIYHIADSNHWEQAQLTGFYAPPSLHTEGFIHCSEADQLEETANFHFNSFEDILLLYIDTTKLEPELKYESSSRGQKFPHIYGPLNIESVVKSKKVKRRSDGKYKVRIA